MPIISEKELEELIKGNNVNYYKICPEFPGRYENARRENALEVQEVEVLICEDKYIRATASVKSNKYGNHAGYIISPSVLKDEIIDEKPWGWSLVRIDYDTWA
jgi:hypothetical protein